MALTDDPVRQDPAAVLGRAVAVGHVLGPAAGLLETGRLREVLGDRHRWHAVRGHLHELGARNLLDSATLLRLAYNGSDGFPRVIPIGFYWTRNQIVVCTAATAPKVKALSSRPHVAMTIDAGDTPTEAKALLVRGLASVDMVDGVPDEYIVASTKVLGADQVTLFERQVRSMYDQMARISIEPVWARFFDFGAGRMPSFLTKLAGDA